MLKFERPYFLTNEEWFYRDTKKHKIFLTDKAPEEARKSYEEFYNPPYEYDAFDYGILKEAVTEEYHDLIKKGKTPEEARKDCEAWWKKLTKKNK